MILCALRVLCGLALMNILVTAGNTQAPIDRVRAITNIFTGRTGTSIALAGHQHGHQVTLLTSHPELAEQSLLVERWTVKAYRTFDDLHRVLESHIRNGAYDALIHSAAVGDYRVSGVYAPAPGTRFDEELGRWISKESETPALIDRAGGKVKSDEAELWLRMVRTPKLVDLVRAEWGFRGILVKFKLEVDVTTASLREIAENSRRQSKADLMVANTLEDAGKWALVGPIQGDYQTIDRPQLAARVVEMVESLHKGRSNG
jgi:phosphopantothenoylcysteine synthetase/decarboxylase